MSRSVLELFRCGRARSLHASPYERKGGTAHPLNPHVPDDEVYPTVYTIPFGCVGLFPWYYSGLDIAKREDDTPVEYRKDCETDYVLT